MSTSFSPSFDARARKIRRNNRRVAGAANLHLGPDGLLTLKPARRHPGITLLRCVLVLAVVLIAAKAVMLTAVGPLAYDQALSTLNSGPTLERVGAFIMQADGLTQTLAAALQLLLR